MVRLRNLLHKPWHVAEWLPNILVGSGSENTSSSGREMESRTCRDEEQEDSACRQGYSLQALLRQELRLEKLKWAQASGPAALPKKPKKSIAA